MRVATAAYPLDRLDSWADYRSKLTDWVAEAAAQGAELLVFPEYGAMELATLDGIAVSMDLEQSLRAVSKRVPASDELHADLAARFGVHILAASAPVFDPQIGARPVNRARLFAPTGGRGHQDKQIMTRFERETWGVVPGGGLQVFDTTLGRLGVLICYDAEFPLLGRALVRAGAEVILVPSCTDAWSGYWRVRIGAMARALEGQCVTVMSSIVGDVDWSPAVDENRGRGGVFGPPDRGFPTSGVLAEGGADHPGWTYADIDLGQIAEVRADGIVLNAQHWAEQTPRDQSVTVARLR